MNKFLELGLSEATVATVQGMGFETPTDIQAQAIPLLLANNTDMIGLAQTGTGKTAAFGLPLVELVDAKQRHVQALVLAPTRELCLQITKELEQFGKHLKKLKILSVYGGADIVRQMKALKSGVHIVVATPGRLRDLIRRKAIRLGEIDFVVLDEADEMLNMGFKEEIDDILENTPDEKLTWLFSATMPKEVRQISKNYMTQPKEISVRGENIGNADIDHQYITIYPSMKYEALKRFLDFDRSTFGLIFCRTRRDCKDLADKMLKDGYNADALHGDLNQAQRDRVMSRFRSRSLQVLIATDVAARGIDVQDITHVFHFNIPDDLSFYTHRSGRTGRAGKKGISIVFAHPKDVMILKRLERRDKIKFTEAHIPTGKEICETQLMNYLRRLRETEVGDELDAFLPSIHKELESLSRDELINRIAALSFNRFVQKYLHAPDLNHPKKAEKQSRNRNAKMHRLFINVGKMDVENKGQFLSFVCKYGKISGHHIGKIDMQRSYSHFDVQEEVADLIKKQFRNLDMDGRAIRVNDSEPLKTKKSKRRKEKKLKWKGKRKNKR